MGNLFSKTSQSSSLLFMCSRAKSNTITRLPPTSLIRASQSTPMAHLKQHSITQTESRGRSDLPQNSTSLCRLRSFLRIHTKVAQLASLRQLDIAPGSISSGLQKLFQLIRNSALRTTTVGNLRLFSEQSSLSLLLFLMRTQSQFLLVGCDGWLMQLFLRVGTAEVFLNFLQTFSTLFSHLSQRSTRSRSTISTAKRGPSETFLGFTMRRVVLAVVTRTRKSLRSRRLFSTVRRESRLGWARLRYWGRLGLGSRCSSDTCSFLINIIRWNSGLAFVQSAYYSTYWQAVTSMYAFVKEHEHPAEAQPMPITQARTEQQNPVMTSSEIIQLDNQIGDLPRPKPKKRYQPKGLSKTLGVSVTTLLEHYLPLSETDLSFFIAREIETHRKQIEDRTYCKYSGSPDRYLEYVYREEVQVSDDYRGLLERVLDNRVIQVLDEIQEGKLRFPRRPPRKPVQKLNEVLQIQQSQLKNKLTELKDTINDIISDQAIDHLLQAPQFSTDYFSPHNPKTKQAEEFVRQINLRREQQRQREREARRKEQEDKRKREEEEERRRQESMSERHLKIKERHEMRRQAKIKEEQTQLENLKQFREFVKEYNLRKPLFKKKEEEFSDKFLIPEMERYKMRLEQIKERYHPLTNEELEEHEKWYLEAKQQKQHQKREERKVHSNIRQRNSEYYRGKFHDIVLSEMEKEKDVEDPKVIQKIKREKQWKYAEKIKKPKIDPNKKKQLEELIMKNQEGSRPRNSRLERNNYIDPDKFGSSNEKQFLTPDPKADGLKNLQALRRMVENSRRKGLIKKSQPQRAVSVSLQPRPDYLKQIRQRRMLSGVKTSRIEDPLQKLHIDDIDNYQRIRLKANLIDEHAERRERYIKYNRNTPVQSLQQGSKLEEDYLASIKAKLSLLHAQKEAS